MSQDFYDEYWRPDGWPPDVPRGRFPPELQSLFERHVGPGTAVLDAGCGDGSNYGDWLARRAGDYTGVDVSDRAVEAARGRGLSVHLVTDLTALGFPDAQFDVCVVVEVLEHLVFPNLAAKELLRVLKPGGILIATVPNIVYWRRRLDYALIGRWHPGGHPDGARYPWRDPHVRFFTTNTMRRMLVDVGFDILQLRGINGSFFGDLPFVARRFGTDRLSRPLDFLQLLWPAMFGANLAVVAARPAK
jgi:methionine biosynthesis protein MetW